MLSVQEAVAQLLASARPVQAQETLGIEAALGRITAAELKAPIDVPPADNSAMDGYTFRNEDWGGADQALPLGGRITAGMAPGALAPGTAMRIFTGAEIPAGADTVVMQEHCRAVAEGVCIEKLPPRGANIRPRGQDMRVGQAVIPGGSQLRPQELGLLASLGQAQVSVKRRLRVAVLSNGDELREPGEPLEAGQIYNSNRPMLLALLRAWGFEAVDLGIVRDQAEAIGASLQAAAADSDVIISSGGVSVGEEDHIKDVVRSLGELALWKIAMKPGKPLAFGQVCGTPFIGLPGNPASALVTCLVIARPYLMACQGAAGGQVSALEARSGFSQSAGPREVYHRVRLNEGVLELYPNQSSGVLLSSCWADALAVQPPGLEIRPGDVLHYLPFAALL